MATVKEAVEWSTNTGKQFCGELCCKNCIYCLARPFSTKGDCRALPPYFQGDLTDGGLRWPQVDLTSDYCGKFTPRQGLAGSVFAKLDQKEDRQ